MSIVIPMTQPAPIQQIFTQQPISYHAGSADIDPELKKLLPLVFVSLRMDVDSSDHHNSEIFAPYFVDNERGELKKSVSSQRVMPIAQDDLRGISTYFSKSHPGIDYRANIGATIHSILPGTVNQVGFERGGYGHYVVLVHHMNEKTLFSLYAHMGKAYITKGDVVEAGDKIGEVGLTGHTTGPHLHFELHDSTVAMNPQKFFANNGLAMVIR